MKRLSDISCECCGVTFHPRSLSTRFCSKSCRAKIIRIQPAVVNKRKCLFCRKLFLPKYSYNAARYCSHKCSADHQHYGIERIQLSERQKISRIRSSTKYKTWRKLVLKRDNYICQICGITGVKLHADHIKKFAVFISLRFDVNNGRTLCVYCHRKTPTYGSSTAMSSL